MKKYLLGLIILLSISYVLLPDAIGWCKRQILDEPTTYAIEPGDYLSKISLKYYGTAKYWQELALINRAPHSDLVFPGEVVFVPSREVIEALHRARSFSKVNELLKAQELMLANARKGENQHIVADTVKSEMIQPAAETDSLFAINDTESMKNSENSTSNIKYILIGVFSGLILLGLISIVIVKKVNESKERQEDHQLKPVIVSSTDEEEPDYQEYLKNKKEKIYA
ncbi:LysM peptidoglycan-binding domain-containing protein [candidate division KSB1 bacterium]|nr:LysM peptidoglycan-binding domain-containing protein [candidate division KSB1 bacterium]